MSLRRRLLIGLLVLVGVGLIVANLATYLSLRSFLNGRVEAQLSTSLGQALSVIAHPAFRADDLDTRVDPSTFLAISGPDGTVVVARQPSTDPTPVLPAPLPVPPTPLGTDPLQGPIPPIQSFTTGSVGGSGVQYRAESVSLSDGATIEQRGGLPGFMEPGSTVLVAVSLAPMSETLHRLLVIEEIVTGLVLAAMVLLTLWIVRRGLRPLQDMAATAGTIAEGDLTRRVAPTDPNTEVGQLGLALNAMLSQIEAAFEQRRMSEERLRQFVADASHELRTPLTSIRGYAELFRRGAGRDPEGLERAMGRIEGEAVRMGTLVDDLLLLARLDQGRPLERVRLDLAPLVAEAVDDARVVEPGRPISFDADGPVVVSGDEDRLRQVVANLLANALSHTSDGTPVHVRALAHEDKGVIEVADEGDGLDPDQVAHVFDRFYRTDSARMRGGVGLGLSIVAAIATALEGAATVTSTPGEGAVFRVELPLVDRATTTRPVAHPAIGDGAGHPSARAPQSAPPPPARDGADDKGAGDGSAAAAGADRPTSDREPARQTPDDHREEVEGASTRAVSRRERP